MKVKFYKHSQKVIKYIKECNINNHIYQSSYNIENDLITQVCFTCNTTRTNMRKGYI
jgi:hypothetical protein